MRLQALALEGLRHAADWSIDSLDVTATLPPAPVGIAVADGIALLAAALDPSRTEGILDRAGLVGPDLELLLDERNLPEQVSGLEAPEVEALLDPEGGRRVVVEATVDLDPPLFGQLREESMRDPRMLAALGASPTVTVKVGWLFTADHATASVGVLEVKVADTPFPTGRAERPRWMDSLLRGIGQRLGGVGARSAVQELGMQLVEASLSPDPLLRARFRRLCDAMAEAPFGLGRLELVGQDDGVMPCFGPALTRARQLGPRAVRALRLAAAALLDAPDVLVVEDDVAEPWIPWLTALTVGDDATLEQVLWLPAPDAAAVRASTGSEG